MTHVNRTTVRRALATTLALAALGTASLVCAAPAGAIGKDGYLEPGELGLYYAQNRTNLLFDLYYAGNNFADDRYARELQHLAQRQHRVVLEPGRTDVERLDGCVPLRGARVDPGLHVEQRQHQLQKQDLVRQPRLIRGSRRSVRTQGRGRRSRARRPRTPSVPRSPPMPSHRAAAPAACLALLAVLLTGLTGCGSASGAGSGAGTDAGTSGAPGKGAEPAVGAAPTLLDSNGLTFPMDDYLVPAEQRQELQKAQNVLIDQCMRRYGFRYTAPEATAGADVYGENGRRYGLSSPALAARYGYGDPPRQAPVRAPRPARGTNESLVLDGPPDLDPKSLPGNLQEAEKARTSDKNTGVVNGVKIPVAGCAGESGLKLYAPDAAAVDITFPQNLNAEANERSRQDSRVVRVIRDWSACMAGHGYRVPSPLGVPAALGLTDLSGPRALTTATADVACKQKVNLVGVWYTVESAYQKVLIEKNAELLKTFKDQQQARMRLADSLSG